MTNLRRLMRGTSARFLDVKNVAPGRYALVAWSGMLDAISREIDVASGQTPAANEAFGP
ncbi:MAG: hypothetical protein JXO72_08130 [Vicinamibacteria bacterium]|nr:hypothetical protein [Vicinamibacteria bacterium]